MTQEARLFATIFVTAATIVLSSPERTFAQEAAQLTISSSEVLTLELSAATNQHKVRRDANSGKPRSAMWSRIHSRRSAKASVGRSKVGITRQNASKINSIGGLDKGKIGTGPSKMSNGLGKMSNGPGKLGAGPAGAGTNGKLFMDNMGPTTTPSAQDAQTSQNKTSRTSKDSAPGSPKKKITEKEWIEKHGALMDRNLKKNPNRDPSELSDLLEIELNKIYTKVDAPKSVTPTPERILTPEERRAYGEASKKDHEETERLLAEQKARENFNPNAEKLRDSGITKEEHEELNQKTLPGKPNGTE